MSKLKICRICLNTNVKGYSLDLSNLREAYEALLGIILNPQDGFPYWACFECAALLHKFHKFKEKCQNGQKVLEIMQSSIPISYKSVSQINRLTENLNSSLSVVVASKHIKTYIYKYAQKLKKGPKKPPIEHIYYDNDSTVKNEEGTLIPSMLEDSVFKQDEDLTIPNIIEQEGDIKIELITEETDNISIDNEQDDNISIDNDHADILSIDNHHTEILDSDHITNADYTNNIDQNNAVNNSKHDNLSSDDENIFLDIIKKNKGENLVFLDAKNSIIDKSKPKRFIRTKKVHLPTEYWKKYWLAEEEAVDEFKKKELDDKYMKANYKCQLCLKWFSKQDILIRHEKLKHDECLGSMECKFCHMRFKFKYQLTKHMVLHYAVFHCLRCDMRFHLEPSAISHEAYHNGVVKKCKECGKEFKHSSTMYTHMRMSHRSAHICNLCGESYVSEAGLAQHSQLKHFDKTTETSTTKSLDNNIYCEKCDLKFISQSAYNRHLSHSKLHIDEIDDIHLKGNKEKFPGDTSRKQMKKPWKPTTCNHCGKHFPTQAACMKHHVSEHPGKTFYSGNRHICEVCGASVAAGTIAYHINKHTRERLHSCDTCGMQFTMKANLRRHQATHTGDRPYPCPLCEKRFTQKNSMQLHYRTFHLKQPYPKRNRKPKADEMPIMES